MSEDPLTTVLNTTSPLQTARATRFPLLIWQVMDPPLTTEAEARDLIRELDDRGIALPVTWDPARSRETLEKGRLYGRLQQELGLPVPVNANPCVYGFFDGSPETAHIDDDGKRFYDTSIPGERSIGCPFALSHRIKPVRAQLESFLDGYLEAGIRPTLVFADWEIDGPLEINNAHDHAIRCRRCQSSIPDIHDFRFFRDTLRRIRCDLTRVCYSEPVLRRFPSALVGNYGVYSHDGYRYWYDWFEAHNPSQPAKREQGAFFREWFHEFPLTGYGVGMPVVYPWAWTHHWFDYSDSDYRWFYGMMKCANNAGSHRPAGVPNVAFVHWHTVLPKERQRESTPQMSAKIYQELLRHMMLRATDGLFLWCRPEELGREVKLVHQVFCEIQPFAKWVDRGEPLIFSLPSRPEIVVSASRVDGRILTRRTDFGEAPPHFAARYDLPAGLRGDIPANTWVEADL